MLPPPEPFVNGILGILTIRQMNIEGVDLNLLGPLAALLEERHVSRAADRQHMSQPSMSRALRELRIVSSQSSHSTLVTPGTRFDWPAATFCCR